jgi:ribose/xylose/arabinose/galactoside ABC-type transport system permease subunit
MSETTTAPLPKGAPADAPSPGPTGPRGLLRNVRAPEAMGRFGIQGVFFVALIVMLVVNPEFRNVDNIKNVLQQSSITGILACGMLVIIITGGFDLSFGAIGIGSSVSAATLMSRGTSPGLAVAVGVAIGLVCGVFNGFMISRLRITPFVATLGSSTLIGGLVLIQTDGRAVAGLPAGFTSVGLGQTLGIPNPAWVFLAVGIVTWVLLHRMRIGHYVYAVGSSSGPSRLAGIPVDRVLLVAYVFGGVCAGIAGIILLGQTNVGQPTGTEDWALAAIAAVVVGGTPLRGGLGGLYSVVLGTLLLGFLANALNLYGVSPYVQPAVTGAVILLAVGFDSLQRKGRAG